MSFSEKRKAGEANTALLGKNSPEVMGGFAELHKKIMGTTAISVKEKELIALGIAIAIRCEGCILAHVNAAKKAGVTLEEIYGVIEVAILMSGGPGTAYGGIAAAYAEEVYKE
ncbi:MAG: carboxymuconolactone decarboxylase family protein [Miniphocaeibacter sp.]|uniref:carboxymuconolactone decarboxylase family protein n=1 Tax=Miniphocaeibacter sp. TaxID=3100973 RepID=UPI001820E009|nr:carboxymuconolactone decarboxylase family protein [Gallicola sp.]